MRVDTGLENMHVTLHVIVENQILLGETTPVLAAMKRLAAEGLDRHEAIHAVAGVLAWHMREMLDGNRRGNEVCFAEIERLTAETWRKA